MAKEINADTWEKDVKESDKPVVVDFWHEQCIWCVRLSPVYEELSKEYDKAVFTKLNIRASDENMEVAQKYGIMGTPTMKVFCDGHEVGEIIGFREKNALKEELDNMLKNSESCLKQSTILA